MLMGFKTEQVAGGGFDWTQQGMVERAPGGTANAARVVRPHKQRQQQAAAQLQQPLGTQPRCPRCDSPNTKFCYYNNYSRAQPRHFCKACRRHWTDGGTLRNVPVGGGRKAKRPKTSHPSTAPTASPAGAESAITVMQATSGNLPSLSFSPDHILSPALLPTLPPPSAYDTAGYLGALLSLPTTSRAACPAEGAVGCPFSTSTPFSFFSPTEQNDIAAAISTDNEAGFTAMAPLQWEDLLLDPPDPPARSGMASGSPVTTGNSGLTTLESSSPSSGYWSNCWEDLTGFLSVDLEDAPPPPPDALPLYKTTTCHETGAPFSSPSGILAPSSSPMS